MAGLGFWKILRVLTTNACNYKCVFCHNEGQDEFTGLHTEMLNSEHFKWIVKALIPMGLKEIQFSGGEPFMNPDTIEMIMWANDNTDLEIGCATNTQFFKEDVYDKLSKTRIKLHIQFPTINEQRFEKITKTKLFNPLMENLKELRDRRIYYSLNYVLLSPDIEDFKEVVEYLYSSCTDLKILPFINNSSLKKNEFKRDMIPYLDSISFEYENQKNGSLKWWIKTPQGETIAIKYIDSPCFDYEFDTCKNYAEIRLLPDLALQSCLLNPFEKSRIDFELCEENLPKVQELFQNSWMNFTHC